jgi:hypothetical protein
MDFSSFTADSFQIDNISGIQRFWKVLTKTFIGEFPSKAAVVNGEVVVDPLSLLPAYFVPAEYVVPPNTKGFDYESTGGDGSESWKHIVTYEFAGHNKAMIAEMNKDLNAKAVYFMEDTDGQINVVGSSVKGLRVSARGGSGKMMGGDKRGAVFTGEETGFKWIPVPLSAAVANAWRARAKGYVAYYVGLNGQFAFFGGSFPPTQTLTVDDIRAFKVGDAVKVQQGTAEALVAGQFGFGIITQIVDKRMTIEIQNLPNPPFGEFDSLVGTTFVITADVG